MRIVKSVQNEKRSGQNWKNSREISRLIGRIVECEEGVVKEHFNKMIYSMNCVKLQMNDNLIEWEKYCTRVVRGKVRLKKKSTAIVECFLASKEADNKSNSILDNLQPIYWIIIRMPCRGRSGRWYVCLLTEVVNINCSVIDTRSSFSFRSTMPSITLVYYYIFVDKVCVHCAT